MLISHLFYHFTTLLAFRLYLTYHIWSSIRGLLELVVIDSPDNTRQLWKFFWFLYLHDITNFLCHGIESVDVSQHPSQVIFWMAHSLLSRLMKNPLASNQCSILSSNRMWCFQVNKKSNIVKIDSSVVNITNYLLHNLLGKVRSGVNSQGSCLYLYLPNGMTLTQISWLGLSSLNVEYCMKSFVKILYPYIHFNTSLMIGKGYRLCIIALSSGC